MHFTYLCKLCVKSIYVLLIYFDFYERTLKIHMWCRRVLDRKITHSNYNKSQSNNIVHIFETKIKQKSI